MEFEVSADYKPWRSNSLWSGRPRDYDFQNKFQSVRQTTVTLPQTILNELYPKAHSSVYGSYSYMPSSLSDSAFTYINGNEPRDDCSYTLHYTFILRLELVL